MKILQVCPRYPPQTGGVETHVKEISERLVDRGHEVSVHTADAALDGRQHERREGVEIRRHLSLAPGGAYHFAPGIQRAVRRGQFDLVHGHNVHSLPVAFAALGLTDEAFVVTAHYHGSSTSAVRNGIFGLFRPILRRVLRRADAVIAVSEWEQTKLHADFGVGARMVPNGVDKGRFEDAPAEQRERPYLLCVGRLESYKGVQHAIRALTELPTYDLVVVGQGPYANQLTSLATELGLGERVEFLGTVPDDRLVSLYHGAAALLALSTHESFGLAVAEAIASGTPCVVFTGGALGAWSRLGGVVGVESFDSSTVAEAVIETVGCEPNPADVTSWSQVLNQLKATYRSVIEPAVEPPE